LEIKNHALALIYAEFWDRPSIFSNPAAKIAEVAVPKVHFFNPSIGIAGFRY